MKIVSESTWTFQMMIFFILIFACFLTLVLNYNKAYTVKNRMLTIVEKYEGITLSSQEIINDYISNKGYQNKGKCPNTGGWIGAVDLNGKYEIAKDNNTYFYCFLKNVNNSLVSYDIKVFFKFELPVIGSIANYDINGTTKSFIGAEDQIEVK